MENRVKITRLGGEGTLLSATIHLELDCANPEHLERLGRLMRDLIPEQDRDAFLDELHRAAEAAGITAPEALSKR